MLYLSKGVAKNNRGFFGPFYLLIDIFTSKMPHVYPISSKEIYIEIKYYICRLRSRQGPDNFFLCIKNCKDKESETQVSIHNLNNNKK